MKKPNKRKPFATQLDADMPLAEKMARIRNRVRAKGYFNHKHPSIVVRTSDRLHFQKVSKLARKDKLHLNSYARRTFTSQEIEQMWLAVCRLMDFFGGNKALAAKECQVSTASLNHWIEIGRISPLGADIIHHLPEVPFSREELRPDLSPVAWRRFDKRKNRLYARRENMTGGQGEEDGFDDEVED